MESVKEELRNNIYEYCDNNVGKKVLFPGFRHLYISSKNDSSQDIIPQEITNLTSKILNELTERKILKEVKIPKGFSTPYAMYKISRHKKLKN